MKSLFFFTLLFYPIFAVNISGIIIDESNNNPLVGANVFLSNLNEGSATNNNGEFLITDISPGIYELEVSAIGYKNYSKSSIFVSNVFEFRLPNNFPPKLFSGVFHFQTWGL